jgi:hypothetical protein
MANFNVTPNMQLPNPVPGVDPGPDYASNLQSCMNIIDQHNHTTGQGVQIVPAAININADLPFNSNNAISLRSVRFVSQSSPIANSAPNVGILYVSGNELWYNDYTGGNQVQITTNGQINATSSGIASGTATAAFSAGTLVVKSSSTSFANVDLQSVLLSNAGNLTNQLTLLAPTLSSSYDLTLPVVPSVTSIMALDSSGNISAPYTVDNSTIVIASNVIKVASQGITATQIANTTITAAQIVNGTITGTQIASNVSLSGSGVKIQNTSPVLSSKNTAYVQVVRGYINSSGGLISGEGISVINHVGTGVYNVYFSTTFATTPAITITPSDPSSLDTIATFGTLSTTMVSIYINQNGSVPTDSAFCFIAMG